MSVSEIIKIYNQDKKVIMSGVPASAEAYVYFHALKSLQGNIVIIAQSDSHMRQLQQELLFFDPSQDILIFPEWDCLPYDRTSPSKGCLAERIKVYNCLAQKPDSTCIITTMAALSQKIPPVGQFYSSSLDVKQGQTYPIEKLVIYFEQNGYERTDVVYGVGEYAVRGSLFDLYPPGSDQPYRIDFFGDEVESIKTFDPETQRSLEKVSNIFLAPLTEVFLTNSTVELFRTRYRELFGIKACEDPLYQAITDHKNFIGYEHWLPLFYPKLSSFMDVFSPAHVFMNEKATSSLNHFQTQIMDHFQARQHAPTFMGAEDIIYRALDPSQLYLTADQVTESLNSKAIFKISSLDVAEGQSIAVAPSKKFIKERQMGKESGYRALKSYVGQQPKKILVTARTKGALNSLLKGCGDHFQEGEIKLTRGFSFATPPKIAMTIAPFIEGFATDKYEVLTEQDILGDQIIRRQKGGNKKKLNFELENFKSGDLLVHKEHGLGRYVDLQHIQVNEAAHDCLEIEYANGDKLFVPVENIDVLSIYGSADDAPLDRLGSTSWQTRKEKVQERIFEIAEGLMTLAAKRQDLIADAITCDIGIYNEFCQKFPYVETEDQLDAINDIVKDMGQTRPMDRLLCGDVGFGKTEVAMRAAFIAAASGLQVAIVVPTTILCHQHYENFLKRFHGFDIKIDFLSRLKKAAAAKTTKENLEKGETQIIIGTHALLSKTVKFSNLGLIIMDEEQHFGVKQKEYLKSMAENVHVLSMSATPIPRTLQMAVAGIRDLSIIATPPVDRLAVNTFVMPFDSVTMREVILREHQRGGQVFCVCPRINDIETLEERLAKIVPEVRVKVGHGQMPPEDLSNIMKAFENRKFDVLISTNIIESGLDIPNVNTLIVYRSDMFGLSQLHQLRGRVGRSKARGYAYFTIPPNKVLKGDAEKRLEILKAVQGLGAGFTLASHDMDIRGPGNLIGQQQSGQIKEVGIGLYNTMLEEALEKVKSGEKAYVKKEDWTPTINLGLEVLIPESYVPDLNLRLSLYRRVGKLTNAEDIEAFTAEMVDRFGDVPQAMQNLVATIDLKNLCKALNIQTVDAGAKGILIGFYKDEVPYLEKLLAFINDQNGTVKLRPDSKMVLLKAWDRPADKLQGLKRFFKNLESILA